MTTPSSPLTGAVLQALEDAGVTHVVGLPDNTSAPLFDALPGHPTLRLVSVTREGEAFALASGLWMGGASPLVVIQNTGFLESGDGLRGTATRMGAALPFVVTGRGYAKMAAAGLGPDTERTRQLLIDPAMDSVALMTEPTLRAWGIPYTVCAPGDDASRALRRLVAEAAERAQPTALLITGKLG